MKPFWTAMAIAVAMHSSVAFSSTPQAAGAANPTAAPAKTSASQQTAAPHQVVDKVTQEMMAVIKNGQSALQNQPEQYFADIRSILEPVVSFKFIAKHVMGNYWAQASAAQRSQFAEAFTRGMVETLGRGMANFSHLQIETLPAKMEANARRVEVWQDVRGGEKPTRVSYSLAQQKSGDWVLINVVLNGVNLGKSFRDQFAQAMKQHNDINKVIAEWGKTQAATP